MIKVICGEDIIVARDYFNRLKKTYDEKGYRSVEVDSTNINQVLTQIDSNLTLFNQKLIYFGQFLHPIFKKNKKLIEKLKKIAKEKEILFYIFEDKKKYDLSIYKDIELVEFKLTKNIFTLLDLFIPGKRSSFLKLMHQVINEKNENLFFYLLVKRVRDLLVIKNGGQPEKIQSWQRQRLKKQSQSWDQERLISAYQSLFHIDIDQKTSQTPFNIGQSLDIFIYYHLI